MTDFRSALGGEVTSELMTAGNGRDTLAVYVPLPEHPGKPVKAVVEVRTPYAALETPINDDAFLLYLVVSGGLLLLWTVLLGIVARASGHLRGLHLKVKENAAQATRDPLTGLPNRMLFRDRVQQALHIATRSQNAVALLLLDLDRFKEVNDTLGHHYGDLLLQQIGPRLRGLLRDTDTVARLGGDEFGILLVSVTTPATVAQIADKIRLVLQKPFQIQGFVLHIDVSVGIAMFPDNGKSVETLLQRADVAMYMAKEKGGGHEIYKPERDRHSASKLALGNDLRQAIDADELMLHYQPQVHLRTGRVERVEALVRWKHPMRGQISPDDFVPLAERTGLIEQLTRQVLNLALSQCSKWQEQGLDVSVAVNLSVRNLMDGRLPQQVQSLPREMGCSSSQARARDYREQHDGRPRKSKGDSGRAQLDGSSLDNR